MELSGKTFNIPTRKQSYISRKLSFSRKLAKTFISLFDEQHFETNLTQLRFISNWFNNLANGATRCEDSVSVEEKYLSCNILARFLQIIDFLQDSCK